MKTIKIQYYKSIAGELLLGCFENKLCLCDWVKEERRNTIDKKIQNALNTRYKVGSSEVIEQTIKELDEYFAKKRKTFDIPLLFIGTAFQKTVWKELLNIPYGKTLSYKELAQKIDNPKAVRAVANANRLNAISILVPCHRVIGSNNKLVGYGGGLDAKKTLLFLELSNL
jgi:methylated-DNA-[protein]-cysteine S-methyltransferase